MPLLCFSPNEWLTWLTSLRVMSREIKSNVARNGQVVKWEPNAVFSKVVSPNKEKVTSDVWWLHVEHSGTYGMIKSFSDSRQCLT